MLVVGHRIEVEAVGGEEDADEGRCLDYEAFQDPEPERNLRMVVIA